MSDANDISLNSSPSRGRKKKNKDKDDSPLLQPTNMINIPPVTKNSPKTKFKQMKSVTLILSEDDETKKAKKKVNKEQETATKELVSAESDLRKVSQQMEAKHMRMEEIRQSFLKLGGGNGNLNQIQFREALVSKNIVDEAVAARLFIALDTDKSGYVDFREFMMGMAHLQLGTDADFAKKIEYLFKVYDLNGDGGISKLEFYRIFKLGIDQPIQHKYMVDIVSLIFKECAREQDGKRSSKVLLEDFLEATEEHPEIKNFAEEYLQGFDIIKVASGLQED